MRLLVKFACCLLSAGMLLAGCGDAPKPQSADTAKYGDTIKLADEYDPEAHFDFAYTTFAPTWDPIKSVGGTDSIFYDPVYDRLLREDKDGDIHPMLAEEFIVSDDNMTMTLKLREGLTFSDGTPFDAEAVKFNLDRTQAPESRVSGDLYMVTSVEVVDPLTVNLHLSGGIGSLPTALANTAGIMVSPKAAQAGVLAEQPVGIGPYVATNIKPGNSADYEKTPDYWDPDAQRVSTMTYHLMADDQTRNNALRSGDIAGANVSTVNLDSMVTDEFNAIIKQSSLIIYLSVNGAKGSLGDPEVRKALNMAIDREALAQGLYEGYCTPQIQPFPDTSAGYSEKIGDGSDIFPYDPEKAKKMLAEAGASNLNLTLVASNSTSTTKLAEVIQEQLTKVDINVEVSTMPPVPLVEAFTASKTAEMLTSMTSGINDPGVMYQRYLIPQALYNPGQLEYPELAKYGAEAASSLDPEVRKPAYEKFMDAWVEEPPHLIPLCMANNAAVYADNVSGVAQKANGYPDLRGVAISKK